MAKKIRYVCSHCGSENVTKDALASWNTDTQQWEIAGLLQCTDCEDCGGECSIDAEVMPV